MFCLYIYLAPVFPTISFLQINWLQLSNLTSVWTLPSATLSWTQVGILASTLVSLPISTIIQTHQLFLRTTLCLGPLFTLHHPQWQLYPPSWPSLLASMPYMLCATNWWNCKHKHFVWCAWAHVPSNSYMKELYKKRSMKSSLLIRLTLKFGTSTTKPGKFYSLQQ